MRSKCISPLVTPKPRGRALCRFPATSAANASLSHRVLARHISQTCAAKRPSNTFVFRAVEKSAQLIENNNHQLPLSSHSCALFFRSPFIFITLTKTPHGYIYPSTLAALKSYLSFTHITSEVPCNQSVSARSRRRPNFRRAAIAGRWPLATSHSPLPARGRRASHARIPAVAKQKIFPAKTISGAVEVPGDKSISHRYAILAALA